MAPLGLTGTLRTRYLNDVRNMALFRVERPVTLMLEAIYHEPAERLVWMECQQGRWQLPLEMRQFADEVEERARQLVGYDDVLPCRIVFAPTGGGGYEVELRPEGYQPALQT